MKLWQEQRELYSKDQDAAHKLLAIGEAKMDAKLAVDELAASTIVAQALLNYDEVVQRR